MSESNPAPWEKEATSMEDSKKNVSFISGLALLLSVLALVLIGWGNIADSPYETEYKEVVDNKLDHIQGRLMAVEDTIKENALNVENGKLAWQSYKLQQLDAQLGALVVSSGDTYKSELETLQKQVQALVADINANQAGTEKPAVKADVKTAEKPAEKPAEKAPTCDKK